ncbi:MAG: hypothetical protein WC390_10225 [Sulfurimonas sp.]|jgi:hypothetical protein
MTVDELREIINDPKIPGSAEVVCTYWNDDSDNSGWEGEKNIDCARMIHRTHPYQRDSNRKPLQQHVFVLS